MGCCGAQLFFADLLFLVNGHIVQSQARVFACSPTGALLHHCFPSNLSTTTQGAIVKLRGSSSESCTLLSISVWNSKPALVAVRELFWGMLGRGDGGLRGIGVSGSGYNEVLALEMPNVIDCTVFGKHCECNAQKYTHLKRLPPLASHILLLSHCVLRVT